MYKNVQRTILVFTFLLSFGLLFAWLSVNYYLFQHKSVVKVDTSFIVDRGRSLNGVINDLRTDQILVDRFWFKVFSHHENLAKNLKAGEYRFVKGMSSEGILKLLREGRTHQYTITFLEGWTFAQFMQVIKQNPNLHHTLNKNDFDDFMKSLHAESTHPEGLFFPDTYFFEKNSPDTELLKTAYHKMQTVLTEAWMNRNTDVKLKNPYEALILGSIIEKETGAAEERPIISGVFHRRLRKGMLLQTDPTVIYGMGDDYHGDIKIKDLRNPTPYNTYVIEGLPPTPIAMPGKASIKAALNPAEGDSLFFVSKGNGRHVFSATLADHNKSVDKYQR